MNIKNEDLEILKNIELYLYERNSKSFNYDNNGHFIVRSSEVDDIQALDLYFKLYAIIEELEEVKKKLNNKSNEYNKKNREYHNIMNNIYQAKRSNSFKRLKKWEQKLEDYKKKVGNR